MTRETSREQRMNLRDTTSVTQYMEPQRTTIDGGVHKGFVSEMMAVEVNVNSQIVVDQLISLPAFEYSLHLVDSSLDRLQASCANIFDLNIASSRASCFLSTMSEK